MKLMLCIQSLAQGKGGTERVAAELANEMVHRGHDVYVHYFSRAGEKPQYNLHPDVTHVTTTGLEAHASEITNKIRDIDPDVYFIFYFDTNLLYHYGVTCGLDNIPVGVQEGTNPIRAVKNFYRRMRHPDVKTAFDMRASILTGVHGIRFTIEDYWNYIPLIAKPQCRAYPNTFDPANRANPGKTQGRKTIINVGGLKNDNKNGQVLAEAFSYIAHDFPDWDLKYFGRIDLGGVSLIAKANKLEKRIFLNGPTSEIYKEYEDAQIHVICSYEEGCPNVVCEAMLHGLPTIGYDDCLGTNDLVKHNQNGLLISRDQEVENLVTALKQLMSNPGLCSHLGAAAYNDAQIRFDRTKIFDQWEALLTFIASYKGKTERLFEEQCALDKESAEYYRDLRTSLLQQYAGKFFTPRLGTLNEKINMTAIDQQNTKYGT